MRILICDNHVPFVEGGAERLRDDLATALRDRGHEVEVAAVPWKWYPPEQIVRTMAAWRLLELGEVMGRPVDRIIALRFPAYLVRHPAKIVWMTCQMRTAYELWGTTYGDLEHHPRGGAVRERVVDGDARFLPEADRLLAISETVANRLHRSHGLRAEVLRPPVPRAGKFRRGETGDYVFYAARLERLKRQDLLIRAMARVRSPVRCLLAGAGEQEDSLRRLIGDLELEDRVRLLGHVSDAEVLRLYAGALAVCYPAFDEDYGYGPLEAWLAGKPVIAPSDSGGPLELLRDGREGLVVDPDPAAIAKAVDRLADDYDAARRMGDEGYRRVEALDLSWDRVVRGLLA